VRAAIPAEPNVYPPEALADEEPRYLRRQKPLEVRRRKFNRRSLASVRRWMVVGSSVLVGGAAAYGALHFLFFSSRVQLAAYDQIEVTGSHFVPLSAITEKFSADLGKSVLRVPLDARRAALETIPWVEQVSVQRVLPNHIRVDITERTPVAYLRGGADLAMVDASGAILERPLEGDFDFPVVSGLTESMPQADREKRMKLFVEFLKDINLARPGAADRVSEVDLSDAQDVRATLTGLSESEQQTLQVRFGDSDFVNKYRLLVENIGQWRSSVGRVESVDLRFSRQVVVNPDNSKTARAASPGATLKKREAPAVHNF
jgi:cell division protein FtsQ